MYFNFGKKLSLHVNSKFIININVFILTCSFNLILKTKIMFVVLPNIQQAIIPCFGLIKYKFFFIFFYLVEFFPSYK